MEPSKPTPNAETYQEGCTPVQFFSSPAIPVTPDMPLAPRLGRPGAAAGQTLASAEVGRAVIPRDEAVAVAAVAAQAAAAFAAPIAAAIAQALTAVLEAALRQPKQPS